MVVQSLARRAVAGPPQANGEGASRGWVQSFMGAVNVLDAGATGDGTTDDTTAIQTAVDFMSGQGGGVVIFSRGTYRTKAPIEQPENVELVGNAPGRISYDGASVLPCVIKPLSTHSGPAVIRMRGKDETARTFVHVDARVRHLMIDGSAGPSSLKGVAMYGLVREFVIEDVTCYKLTDAGFWCGAGPASTTLMPQSFRFFRCVAHQCGGAGFSFANCTDAILDDCLSIGGGWVGFYIAGFIHGVMNNCKAEWNTQHGLYITSGYWGSGTGAGGLTVTNLETDRNGYNGVYIDATGSAGLHFTGCLLRRDGRNGGTGGGGYAGLFVATTATMAVIVDNIGVFPGVDDDGTKTASPQIGVSATGSAPPVRISSGIVHGITTAIATGTGLLINPMIELRVGPTSGYTSTAGRGLVATDDARLADPRAPLAHTHAIADLPVASSGTSSTTQLVRADDSRLSNPRAPSTHASTHATGGADPITPASIGAAPAGVVVTDLGTISQGTLTPSATAPNQKAVISAAATLAVPAAGTDGYLVNLVVRASGATQTLTLSGSYGTMSGQPLSQQIPVGKQCVVLMRYNIDTARWVVYSFAVET